MGWSGQKPLPEDVYVDVKNWANNTVRLIKTPRVLKVARKQWACPTLEGVPLEDEKVGYGAHWETRVMGPEIMSYGGGTGEGYLSDLTLAFLEDTGHYRMNYSYAGEVGDWDLSRNLLEFTIFQFFDKT